MIVEEKFSSFVNDEILEKTSGGRVIRKTLPRGRGAITSILDDETGEVLYSFRGGVGSAKKANKIDKILNNKLLSLEQRFKTLHEQRLF